MKEPLLISSCFLGNNVKYNGLNNKLDDRLLWILKEKYQLFAVCPEIIGGLSIPRNPSEIKDNKVYSCEGLDVTDNFILGATKVLAIAKKYNIKKALLKESSPSCGSNTIYNGQFNGTKIKGMGITCTMLASLGIIIYNESNAYDLIK